MGADEAKGVIQQRWWYSDRGDDGIYLVSEDGSTIAKLLRPDRGSDLLVAGYITGLQAGRTTKIDPIEGT